MVATAIYSNVDALTATTLDKVRLSPKTAAAVTADIRRRIGTIWERESLRGRRVKLRIPCLRPTVIGLRADIKVPVPSHSSRKLIPSVIYSRCFHSEKGAKKLLAQQVFFQELSGSKRQEKQNCKATEL